MATVVITEFMDIEGVDALRADFPTLYDPDLVNRPDELAVALQDCRGLVVRNRTQVRPDLLAAAPLLEVVGRLGVGLDNIDLAACRARGIPVLPATGTNDKTVADFVMGAVIMMARGGTYHVTGDVLAGRWPRTKLKARDLAGMRIGLIGFGAIAREVAVRARAFDMKVAASDPHVAADDPAWAKLGVARRSFEDMLPDSDVISVHTPLTSQTRGMLDAAALARLPKGAFVINSARGGVIDEPALVSALRDGHLGGAMLDVMEGEPLAADSLFVGAPNLYLSPHVAGITHDAVLRASTLTAENVRRVLKGLEPKVADAAATA